MNHHKIEKVLIANRGEIALRIQRACQKLGIKTVSVASDADKNSLFARRAETLHIIGPAPAKDSYLNQKKLIELAKSENCDAVHPGYGFLSESDEFASAVIAAGLIFIGPDPESISLMGHKTRAKTRVKEFEVPCAPSSDSGLSDAELLKQGPRVGFPLLIKAVAGGGGRGMRIVRSVDELEREIPRARGEALKFFSNQDVFLERYIERPRHVEVQVFGDSHGNLIHLGTRDCSTQRRHQKIIEEAPAPHIEPHIREAIHEAALNAARSVNYKGAGTVEFLLKDNEFFFLEMNTRIQVEHPVTEMITGIDLVELQIRVAQGEKLPIKQAQVQFDGHAIEFRVNAENPTTNFSPAAGIIAKLEFPENSDGVRVDSGFESGDEIPLFYDSMLAKVIVKAFSRAAAIDKSIGILRGCVVEGVPTSLDYQRWLLYNGLFRRGPLDIGFVEREFSLQFVRELRACEVRDPLWQLPVGGSEVKDSYTYTSKKFDVPYTIEVVHCKDGFFMAMPVDNAGRHAKNIFCRLSNGKSTAIESVIREVLEKTPPAEIFN